jgi:hypothetical protein
MQNGRLSTDFDTARLTTAWLVFLRAGTFSYEQGSPPGDEATQPVDFVIREIRWVELHERSHALHRPNGPAAADLGSPSA